MGGLLQCCKGQNNSERLFVYLFPDDDLAKCDNTEANVQMKLGQIEKNRNYANNEQYTTEHFEKLKMLFQRFNKIQINFCM
jgi:hypothetical protein